MERPRLGAVTRVDPHIFRGEIAGPKACRRAASMQVHHNVHMLFEQAVAGDTLIEIKWLATAHHRNAGHLNVPQFWIEFDARSSGGRKDATPVGVATGKRSLDERRSGDGLGDL